VSLCKNINFSLEAYPRNWKPEGDINAKQLRHFAENQICRFRLEMQNLIDEYYSFANSENGYPHFSVATL